jgi:RimJ/RimL family protein N-acetyltransferase
VYERVGFNEAGRLRESWRLGGRQHDVVLMDILASEFDSPVLADHLGLDR